MSWVLVVLGLILFVCLVLIHEWGHYKAARNADVDVEEFGLGFPPKIWGKKLKSGMLLSLNLLPLGGFVRLKGEHDADTTKGSFGAATTKNKVKIMLAGVVMNLLVALGLFTLLSLTGLPKLLPNQFAVSSDTKVVRNDVFVSFVEDNSPASQAGLQVGDKLLRYGDVGQDCRSEECGFFTSADVLKQVTSGNSGQELQIVYERAKNVQSTTAKIRTAEEVETSKKSVEPKGYLGVLPGEYTVTRSTWSAPIQAVGVSGQITWATLKGIGSALGNLIIGNGSKASEQVSGPVGIFFILKEGSRLGINFLLVIIAVISLTLAIMNVLPIPALDGGRLFVMLLFRGLKKPLTQKTEERIHGTGFAALMILFLLITIVDVRRFF
ncbi:MAG: RIP metalloprotease [bacterium]|nr:RIP metalloprotease [bacterium]